MVSTTYRTGPWLGIVRSGSVIVLEASTDPATVAALWEYLGSDTPTIHGVLNAVTSHFGTDLTGMPQFGILVHSDRLHVILRGGMSLAVQASGAADTVSGRDVATWSERSLALPDSLVLTLDAERAAEDDASPALPLGEAVVLLSELSRGLPVSNSADSGGAASSGAASGGAVFGAAVSGAAGASLASHDAGDSPSVGTGGLSVAGAVPAAVSGTGSAADTDFASNTGPASGAGPDASMGSGPSVDPESGTSAGDGLVGGSAAETERDGNGQDGRYAHDSHDGSGESGNHRDGGGPGGVGYGALEIENTGLDGSDFEGRGSDSSDSDAADSDSADHDSAGSESAASDNAGSDTADSDSADSESAGSDGADSDAAASDSTTHDDADLGDTIHGGAPDGAPDGAGDEDAYAGFALAADAEWNAELAEAAGTDQDSGNGSAVESTDGGPHWQSPDDEGDLGQTIYPHLGLDDDQPDMAATDAGGTGVGEEDGDSAGADPAEDGNTTDYDHLFGATELRSVEDAAIRLDENGHELPKESTVPVAANIPPQPPMPPVAGQRIDGEDRDVADGDSGSSADEAAPAPAWQPPSGLLIDSVPWGNSSTGGLPASRQGTADADTAGDPDHDGHTVMRSALAGEAPAAEPLESRPPTGPMVLARLCPAGHANPPSRSQCSECGAAIDSEPREVGRPRLGRMHISTGDVLDLDHSLVIGRQPSVSRVMGGVMPRLVQVHSASGDISRSHVEVRLDGWDVLLVDLKATNGTVLVREGQAPRRLGQGEQAILLNGDIAELGDGVSLLFEGLL